MRTLAVPLALLVLLACSEAASREPVARAASPATVDVRPDACAECHAAIVDEWRGSLHARAWDDPIFRAEYDRAPAQSCRDCHNPSTRASGQAGIDCASCHVREGAIVAARASEAGRAAHAIRVEPRLATVEHCADCHQFRFSDDGTHDPAAYHIFRVEALSDAWSCEMITRGFVRGGASRVTELRRIKLI